MQLDKTAIVIAQRTFLDLVDLSLIVMRRYFKKIVLCSAICIAPFILVNMVLTFPLWSYESLAMQSSAWAEPNVFRFRFYLVQIVTVFLQAPFVLSSLTYFIGQAVFVEQLSVAKVLTSALSRWRQQIVVLGIGRLGLVSFVPLVLYFFSPQFQPGLEIVVYLVIGAGLAYLVRSMRPFAPEILVLERSTLLQKNVVGGQPNFAQRSRWLHALQYNDNFGSHLVLTGIAGWAVACVCGSVMVLWGILFRYWDWSVWIDFLVLPVACWIAAIWMTVIRFLMYMNSRIRTEGWEVELKFKAEAERIEGAVA
jgi:hypothetical protein